MPHPIPFRLPSPGSCSGLVLLCLLGAVGCSPTKPAARAPSVLAPRAHANPWPVPVQVFQRGLDGDINYVATLPATDSPELPSGDRWFVQPIAPSLTRHDVQALAESIRVHRVPGLSLRGIGGIDDVSMTSLAGLASLRMLDLSETRVGSSGLEALVGLVELRALYLRDTPVKGPDLRGIAKRHPRLEAIDVANTPIRFLDVAALAALPLVHLGLEGTAIDDSVDGALHALASSLQVLDLSNTAVGDTAIAGLVDAVAERADETGKPSSADAGADKPPHAPQDRGSPTAFEAKPSPAEPQAPHLVELRLWRTQVSNAAASTLSRLPKLERLDLAETDVGGQLLAVLSRAGTLSRLRSLDLRATSIVDDDLVHLRSATQLDVLSLAMTPIGLDCSSFLTSQSSLRVLSLRATSCTDAAIAKLGQLVELRILDLGET